MQLLKNVRIDFKFFLKDCQGGGVKKILKTSDIFYVRSLIQKCFSFSAVASSEEEIDDEEPELVIEESADDIEAEENVERLTASGISVTVIEKNKQSQPHQQKQQQQNQKSIVDPEKDLKIASDTAKTSKESMGLSSDISVTVVHKKKIDVGGTSSSGPKISVKKESELLVSVFLIYSMQLNEMKKRGCNDLPYFLN